MTSIIAAVFKATIGLVVNKGRDKAAAKLKEGDVTDHKFRSLIVRELDEIKSKLEGLGRKDLLASISFFKEGVIILCEAFETANCQGSDRVAVAAQAASLRMEDQRPTLDVSLQLTTAGLKTVLLAEGLKNLRPDDLDELDKESLSDAKGRFQETRRKATEAFSNEGLDPSDRILAMMVRVIGTILEKVDNPANALAACRICLEELHVMPAVQKSFNVELTGGFKSWFNKAERREIITNVCQMNHVIYDVTQMVASRNKRRLTWPCINTGIQKIEPLRDVRISRYLEAEATDINVKVLSFGQGGAEEHKLNDVEGISTNSKEHVIVGDNGSIDRNVKVFDVDGKFMLSLFCFGGDQCTKACEILDVATDQDDNVYVLADLLYKSGKLVCGVCVFDKDYCESHCFDLRDNFKGWALSVEETNKRIFVLGFHQEVGCSVEVYESGGFFICNFVVPRAHPSISDITAGNEDNILLLIKDCVKIYTTFGVLLHDWSIDMVDTINYDSSLCSQRFFSVGEHVYIAKNSVREFQMKDLTFRVSIYTKEGEFVHSIHQNQPST